MKNIGSTRLKKDDKVKVLAGKDKGKISKVIRIDFKNSRVLIENVNMVKRHMRPNAQNKQGGIVDKEAPLAWSNVMLVCSKCLKPTRVSIKTLDDGKRVRVCKKCNEVIDA